MAGRNDWATPPELFDLLDREFDFTLDAAASHDNAKCGKYMTGADDGLAQSWRDERVFLNPPYSNGNGGKLLNRWIDKCISEVRENGCQLVVACLVSDTSTRWFHKAASHAQQTRFLLGRVKYIGAGDSPPFGTVVMVFRAHEEGTKRGALWDWRKDVENGHS